MLPKDLLEYLADGRRHRRSDLASRLGRDIDALAEDLTLLGGTGLELVESIDDRVGLSEPIEWIDVAAVESAMTDVARVAVDGIDCSFEIESTNRRLLEADAVPPGRLRVALAEYQHGGRGRRGRSWIMPPGAGLALSVAWCFATAPAALSGLSLAAGAAARRAIREVAGIDIGLKWPNDLIVDGGKLGGILVELDALPGGACHVVVGIGINVGVPAACLAGLSDFRHGARDLKTAAPARPINRSQLAGTLLSHLFAMFHDFGATGFEPYRQEWLEAHVLAGADVELRTPAGVDYGTVCGIEDDGALLVEHASGERRRVVAGDVSVRISG